MKIIFGRLKCTIKNLCIHCGVKKSRMVTWHIFLWKQAHLRYLEAARKKEVEGLPIQASPRGFIVVLRSLIFRSHEKLQSSMQPVYITSVRPSRKSHSYVLPLRRSHSLPLQDVGMLS
jgi:hypothetical protein